MKHSYLISLASVLAAIIAFAAPARALDDKTGVCINEIYTLGGSGQDWVELYNPTNDEVSLSGWKVIYNATTDDSGNDVIIWQGGQSDVIAARGFVVVYSTPNISSSNSYHIKLRDSGDALMDKIKYPTLAGVGTFQSISRTYDGSPYIEKNPTPTQGYANAAHDFHIKINEVRYDAYGNEFVELYNVSSSSVSLENWTLRNRYAIKTTSPYRYLFQFSVNIDSGSFTSLNASSIDDSLNEFTWADAFGAGGFTKTTDYVALSNSDGQVIDRVHWGGGNVYYDGTSASLNTPFDYPAQGAANDPRSIARVIDGADTGNDANDFAVLNPASEGSTNENSFTQAANTLNYPESSKSIGPDFLISLKLGSNSSAGKGDYLILSRTSGSEDKKSPHYFRLKDLGFVLTDDTNTQDLNYNGSPDINGALLVHGAVYRMVLVTDNASGSAPAITRTEVTVDTVAPSGIYDLAASSAAYESAVELNWTAVGGDGMTGAAHKYIVKYATFGINSGDAYDAAAEYAQSLTPQAPSSPETLTVTGLYPQATYYFSVRAADAPNAFNLSPLSNCATVFIENFPPSAPQGLSADAGLYNKVILSWGDNSEVDLAGYNVYRATESAGDYEKLNDALVAETGYTDEELDFDTTYYYVVTAVDDFDAQSDYSGEVSVYVRPLVTPAGCVVINEIMYDPATAEPATEWVELHNKSDMAVNLSSCVFWVPPAYVVIPDDTHLAPGGFFVLARSTEAANGIVDFVYGGVSVGSIQLKNSGDTVYLTTPAEVLIDSVTYSSSWGAANGTGPDNLTLQRKYPDGTSNDFSNWGKSIDQNGTPKAANNTDLVPPNIGHTPVGAAYADKPVTIDAGATDNMYWYSGNVKLYYKISSTDTYTELNMPGIYDKYTAVIPGGDVTIDGIDYYIRAIDDYNNIRTTPAAGAFHIEVSTYNPYTLVVNEIMYDPPDAEPQNEWVELYNYGAFDIDISSWYFGNRNSEITIPPGLVVPASGYFVLGYTSAATQGNVDLAYSGLTGGSNIQFSNLIAQITDIVKVKNPDGLMVDEVPYSSNWGAANVAGPNYNSLERLSAGGPSDSPSNWLYSNAYGGTPRAKNSSHMIRDVKISPEIFNPDASVFNVTSISFTYVREDDMTFETSSITVRIIKSTEVVRELSLLASATYAVMGVNWDGRNSSEEISYGIHRIEIEGVNGDIVCLNNSDDRRLFDYGANYGTFDTSLYPAQEKGGFYRTTFSKPSVLTIPIRYNDTGQLARHLAYRAPVLTGNPLFVWDGKDMRGRYFRTGQNIFTLDNTIEEKLFGHTCVVLDDANISGLAVSPKKYFNPDAAQSATISYTLSKAAKVTAKIYSRESGAEIKVLLDNAQQSAGANQIVWNGRNASDQLVPDGVYTVVIKTASGDVKAAEAAVIGH